MKTGLSNRSPQLASLDGNLKREKLLSGALTTYLKVVPMVITLREENRGTFYVVAMQY